ncbi:MAG: conjugative transfer ATPase [Gammaproteobacteria bacterium]|nr:conjugative transfer ATPase [Gammaproteobacteria bacterium]
MKLKDYLAKSAAREMDATPESPARPVAEANGGAKRPAARKGVAPSTAASMYRPARSFVDHVPWAEALSDGTILLEDGRSVGAVWEIEPRGTEGRGGRWLTDLRNGLHDVLQDSFEEFDAAPWVVQTYTWREPDLSAAAAGFRDYVAAEARDTEFSTAYADILAAHYRGVAKPGGLFADRLSQTRWAGARQRTLVVVYRWLRDAKAADGADASPAQALLEAGGKLTGALEGLGVGQRRLGAAEFHAWLTRWFNAWTDLTPDDPAAFARDLVGDEDLPCGDGFAETLFYSHPRSDADSGAWVFDRTAMRVLTVEGLRRPPAIGHVTGETRHGDAVNAVLDQLPEGTVYVTTLVPVPQDTVDAHVDRIASSATGESADAIRARADCRAAKEIMGERHKLYRLGVAFYLRAPSTEELDRRTAQARTALLRHGFRAVAPKDDVRALDNFLLHLPMAYEPDADRAAGWRQTRLAWVQHAANVWPLFGRSTGTGHPGLSFFNRGGEPLSFDPLNKLDRLKNAHGLLVGPTGAGKSATLGGMLAQLMAAHRPRLFVIEAGNSFGLLADWFESLGLSVNRVALKPGSGVSLPTFTDAALLPEAVEVALDTETPEDAELPELGDVADDDEDEPRDILGELETVATLMVTGGEAKEVERLRRADRRVIRDAVIEAAKNARAEGATPRTDHVRRAFHLLAETREGLLDEARQRLRDMGDAIGLFCDGFAGEVFNRDGDIWPETDVTLVDLAHFAREGYEAHLAIALISLLNVVNNIAERDQRTGREIVVAIDEAHIVTTHPLVSPYLVKIVKMWRKLGAWLWLATQNLEDFPGAARKLLNMIEWWICLVMPKEEVEEMRRFRDLSDAQRELLLSATKAHLQYTEGVVLAGSVETLFRCVPPSLVLALVQTERHEKARRAEIMAEHGCTEVEAAVKIAAEIDAARGIAG